MQTIYQHPRDLALVLFRGEPTQPLTRLKTDRLRLGRWEAAFHIIGESHAVILSYAGVPVFSEMLSCAPLSGEGGDTVCDLSDMQPRQLERSGYGVCVTFDEPVPAAPMDASQIKFAFPAVFGQKPLTRVQWAQDDGTLRWWTLHVYPLQTGVIHVYTTSYFDVSGRI